MYHFIAKLICRIKGHKKPLRLEIKDIFAEYYYCSRCEKKITELPYEELKFIDIEFGWNEK